MKVVFIVSHLLSGGAERTCVYLAEHFAQNQVETYIISLSEEKFYDVSSGVNYISLRVPIIARNIFVRVINIIKRHFRLNKMINSIRPDVVISLMPETAQYLNLKGKKYKLITSERNNPEFVKSEKTKKIKSRVYDYSDGIVFQTKRAKDYYDASIQSKSIVIPNAVGNDLVYKYSNENYEPDKKISAIGRLAEQKDYPTLIKAFSIVSRVHYDYRLEIFGNGEQKESLVDMVNHLRLREKVFFYPACKDALLKIADSTCYVLSSKYEGMPNTLLEAMAMGIPSISTNCPNGPAEIVIDGVNGLLVDVNDSDSLAQKINYLIENPDEANRIGKESKKILNDYNVNSISKRYLEYIQSVFEEK